MSTTIQDHIADRFDFSGGMTHSSSAASHQHVQQPPDHTPGREFRVADSDKDEAVESAEFPAGRIFMVMKTIHRTKINENFTVLPNHLLRDKRLSFRARGLLCMMLSNREDWETHLSWIEEQGTEGRDAARSAMSELEQFGYLRKETLKDGNGRFKATVWVWSDTPESGFTENGFSENGKSAATKNQGKKKQLHEETEDAPLLKEDSGTVVRQLQVEWSAFPYLPSILTMGPKRVTAIRQRIKDPFWLANWKTAIRKAAESDFCKGKNDRQWKADIDWFLRPDTVAKIMEGKYDNRKRTYSGGGF